MQELTPMISEKVFVYGSFTEGLIHNAKIDKYVERREKAYVMGHAFLMPVGYPVLVFPCEKTKSLQPEQIQGEFLTLNAPEIVHKILDDFHGVVKANPEKGLYFKSLTNVYLEGGQVQSCVYNLNPKKLTKACKPIKGDQWQSVLQAAPDYSSELNVDQIAYMKQLASIKGRETHRYNLELCRQLMKLEIVVDKGRRFSLTPLGKDILRYLP